MQVGNVIYNAPEDFPDIVPVFPLTGALLLPGGQLPLNIFEPRYLAMIDEAIGGNRLIGMVQPTLTEPAGENAGPSLCDLGCIGRLTSFSETGDGRYVISLAGICRIRLLDEVTQPDAPYRSFRILPFLSDLGVNSEEPEVDRDALMRVFRAYLDSHRLEADWESIERAGNLALVNSLCMMTPFGAAEKQALLEASSLKARSATLVAMLEMLLARGPNNTSNTLQ
ncbi:LON peptidase substrate-binding domain-containing protein [Rhizobiaceae bacterium BDR2-2]|uniref:LON peptidase substrate-binding domain-containing protein n=1 Tax=Ectorhizobium quercum TaxID=2965071 RepID=A0AAE3SWE2_9HYPH|nr:LON peptidase substrate-binding domain-containing protein [Ectorhizobium quercum]MCX8999290.1 LON peptidase substrate-binding domain-containing protein [Ectorhizobium quercum]